jgi:hypothetical protein
MHCWYGEALFEIDHCDRRSAWLGLPVGCS